jgi:hypothetical protein
MTVTASPADVPPGTSTGSPIGVGNGQTLLNQIAAVQAKVNASTGYFQAALLAALGALQIEAVDYFMGKFWVTAASILATVAPVRVDAHAAKALVEIGLVAADLAAYVPPPAAEFVGNEAQYSVQYVPTFLQQKLNELQTQLVDYYMATGAMLASNILSTMTGMQTLDDNGQPVVYVGTYTWYGLPEC